MKINNLGGQTSNTFEMDLKMHNCKNKLYMQRFSIFSPP